jgi:hypothetical protein
MDSWNVLLRPVVALRRRRASGSDLDTVHPLVNAGLRTVVTSGEVPAGEGYARREPAGVGSSDAVTGPVSES